MNIKHYLYSPDLNHCRYYPPVFYEKTDHPVYISKCEMRVCKLFRLRDISNNYLEANTLKLDIRDLIIEKK